MSINKKPWPSKTAHGIKSRIDTNPDYQRPAVWSKAQKQLLVDTILRDYDVPKFYWRKTGSKPDTYDVVIAKCTYSGATLTGFDYSFRSNPEVVHLFGKVEPEALPLGGEEKKLFFF